MTIEAGERLPEATLKLVTPEGAKDVSVSEYFGGRKIVLFGVPGAFTPTCSNSHLPGFLENNDAILARGAHRVAVISTNDHYVMAAWARFTGAEGRIDFLADGNGTFVEALGLQTDMTARGLGMRCKRFSMIVVDGRVALLNIESKPGQAVDSGAARILEQL